MTALQPVGNHCNDLSGRAAVAGWRVHRWVGVMGSLVFISRNQGFVSRNGRKMPILVPPKERLFGCRMARHKSQALKSIAVSVLKQNLRYLSTPPLWERYCGRVG